MKYLFILVLLLLPTTVDAVWFDSNWDYRVKIEVDPSKVPGSTNLTNFPVYLNLNNLPAGFHNNVKGDGCDIRMVESDETTETPFELVSYATSTDTGELHFKADSLDYAATTTFYIYYGNPAAACYAATDTYGRNNVWTGFNAVWHFKESSGNANDSTSNARNLTNNGTTPYATGLMGNAADFGTTNTGKSFTLANAAGINPSAFTMATWLKMRTDITTSGATLFYTHRYSSGGVHNDLNIHYQTTASVRELFYNRSKPGVADQGPTYSVTLGTTDWHQIVFTYDGTNIRGYLNGALVAGPTAASGSGSAGSNAVTIGGYSWGRLTAYMDLTKSTNSALSADWIATEYNNQISPTTFYWLGAEETELAPAATSTDSGIIWFD